METEIHFNLTLYSFKGYISMAKYEAQSLLFLDALLIFYMNRNKNIIVFKLQDVRLLRSINDEKRYKSCFGIIPFLRRDSKYIRV